MKRTSLRHLPMSLLSRYMTQHRNINADTAHLHLHPFSEQSLQTIKLAFWIFFLFPCRSTHRGILRTTWIKSVRFAPMTNMTGTREPTLSVHSPLVHFFISPIWMNYFKAPFCFAIAMICIFFSPSQLKKIRSLLVAGAPSYDCFYQHLRLLDGAFKLSAKDLRSQVVREACITVAWVLITDKHPK